MRGMLFYSLMMLLCSQLIFGQAGFLDPDFGQGGWVHTDFGGKDQANTLAIQADGKILAGGRTNAINGNYDFALARYLENGELDPDFGNNGTLSWDFGSTQESIEFIYILKDHKIILGGYSNNSPNSFSILLKLHADGSPDMSFGALGVLKYKFGRSTGPLAMAIQNDGKYLVSGLAVIDSFDVDWLVARFYSDGKLDSSFNKIGFSYFNFLTREDIPFSIQVQKDNKIFMTGCAGVFPKANFAFLRLNEDGTPDQSFGNGGSMQTDFQNNQDVAYSSVILDDGRFIASGTAKDSSTNLDFALARYLPDGSPDLSFGNAGKLTYDLKGPVDYGLYMIQQPDGKFLVCGINSILTHNSYVILRFHADGSIDQSFGKKGIASLDVGNILPDNTPSFAMQADGKLVMVANYKDGTNINFLVMRFLNDIIIKNNDPILASGSVKIYPNPITDDINIIIDETLSRSAITIQITNLQSQAVEHCILHSTDFNKSVFTYSLKNLTDGLYFLKWTSDGKTGTIPIIKK